jgi:hypothetical protein
MPISLTGPAELLNQLLGNNNQQNFSIVPSGKLRAGIELNQLLTGKVEQDLGQGKYAVQIRGESLVVESKSPLKANDIIHGRVVGVGEKIEMQRIFKEKATADNQNVKNQNIEYLYSLGKNGYRAVEILQNYRVKLSAEELQVLANALKNTSSPDTTVLTAVVLNKMGVQITEGTLNTIYPVLDSRLKQKFNLHNITAHLDFIAANESHANSQTITELAAFLSAVIDKLPDTPNIDQSPVTDSHVQTADDQAMNFGQDESGQNQQNNHNLFDPSRILLNAQSDSSISHRVSVVPFIVNEQLVEVDVALFSQKQNSATNINKHKRIVLSLNLDMLGKIDVEINLVGKHARINMDTEKNIITNELVKYMPVLKQEFEQYDFRIDELSYGVKRADTMNNVIGSVVEHYITQDSLSRLY